MSYFKATSASDIMKLTSHRNNFEGQGWGLKVKTQVEVLDKNTETTNAVTVVLTDFRRYKYISVAANSWVMNDGDIEIFVEDPSYFYELNGYFFVVGYSTGSLFEGNLIYSSRD